MLSNRSFLYAGALACCISASGFAQTSAAGDPPFKEPPCNMNCKDESNVVPVSAKKPAAKKQRLIVFTDLGADADDQMSLVRLLLYSNEIDIEGLIVTTSTFMMDRINTPILTRVLDAYGKVRENLLLHDHDYPTEAYLKSVVAEGPPLYGMAGVGAGKSSTGSRLLIAELKKPDTRPLWVDGWGGMNVLAQALYDIRKSESPDTAKKLIAKLRVYTISDQDDAGPWIRKEFPDLFYICSPSFAGATWGGMNSADPGANMEVIGKEWLAKNIQQGHGPLGQQYPDVAYGMEGDTPSFLLLIPNGLNEPEHPDYGGWGGRYTFYQPEFEPPSQPRRPGRSQNIVVPSPETRPLWTNAEDTTPAPMVWKFAPGSTGSTTATAKKATITVSRWREDVQNDFAARMLWTTSTYKQANHPPIPVLAPNTPNEFTVHSGQEFHLNATGSHDPDNDSLTYYWFQYVEAGDLAEPVSLRPFAQNLPDLPVLAPKVDSPKTVHFILRLTDKGIPALSRYERVIVHIQP